MNLTAQALLFDMDGTLVDSTVVVERTWQSFAERHGLDGDAVVASAHGRRTAETVAAHAPAGVDVAAETRRIEADEVLATEGVVAVPGAAELLAQIPAGGWALVTSASRALAESRMGAAGLVMPLEVVSADDVREGKPDPEGYLAAAARLGVDARDAIVLEDAGAGIEAGLASGAQVLVVGAHAGPSTDGLPRVPDFRGVSVQPAAGGRLTIRRRVSWVIEPPIADGLEFGGARARPRQRDRHRRWRRRAHPPARPGAGGGGDRRRMGGHRRATRVLRADQGDP